MKWSLVYAANAMPPVALALLLNDKAFDSRQIGLLTAVWAMWLGGAVLGTLSGVFRKSVLHGGIVLGALQLFPLMQYIAALAGDQIASALIPPSLSNQFGKGFGAFSFTIVTGHLLIGLACLIGVLDPARPDAPAPATDETDPNDSPPHLRDEAFQ